jgi:hypothetical protein
MILKVRLSRFVLVGSVALTLPFEPLVAQGRSRAFEPHFKNAGQIGIGWVANVPTSYLGFSALGTTPSILGGLGLYADVKLTTGSPGSEPAFLPDVTPQEAELTFGDQLFRDESDWFTVDLALIYAITPEFALYGGAGYSEETHFRQYFDESETRGEFGFYWVGDADRTGSRTNVLGGAMMRVTRFTVFQAGGQTNPSGVTVGLILTLAR